MHMGDVMPAPSVKTSGAGATKTEPHPLAFKVYVTREICHSTMQKKSVKPEDLFITDV